MQKVTAGKRKTSVARVFIKEGKGAFIVNGKPVDQYFVRDAHLKEARKPLVATELEGKIDVSVNLQGGGLSGQAGAVRHGLAKALLAYNPLLRPILKPAGLLTRDARKVERKKYGKIKSRRSPQFSKR